MRSAKISLTLLICLLSGLFAPSNAQVKITDGAGLTMDPNSLLELESTNKGLLIPRIAINSLILPAPLAAPVHVGMFVYSFGGAVADGFYHWSGAAWIPFATGIGSQWTTNGINIYYNSGNVGIGATPLTALDVNGQITLRTGASAGAILVSDANGTGTWTGMSSVYVTPVTKSASATLLKTETVVLASGDITLTLPAVTSADDGLEITIKNVGSHTDLITIVPEAGKVIDASTASILTRWRGRTFIATGSNWIIKDRETRADNLFDVSPKGSFTTIAEVVEFLNMHMAGPSVVRLGGGTFTIDATQTINLPYPVTFEGISFGDTMIDAAAGVTGNPLFICETECYFKMLTFNAISSVAGNDAIHLTGSDEYYEVKDAYFVGFNRGIVITTNNECWIFDIDFEDCAGAGIEIAAGAASGGSFKISESDFIGCAKGINLLSGVSETVSVMNCTFYNSTGGSDIGILYNPASFTSFADIFITNTAWNNQGTFISGFDFTRSDGRDADAYIENNAGEEDKNPHCKINVVNNTSTTTCVTANAWYKTNWTNTTSYTTKFLITDNKFQYQSSHKRDVYIFISGNVMVNNNNRNITVGIVKNGVTGTRYGETTLRTTTANQPFQFSSVIYLDGATLNDYFEVYCSSATGGDILRFQDINIFIDSK